MSEEIMNVAVDNNEIASIDGCQGLSKTIINTIDTSTFEGSMLSYNAQNTGVPLNGMEGEEIVISDMILKEGMFLNRETGELRPVVQTYLITPEGKCYFSISEGISRCASSILDSFKTPDRWPNHQLTVVPYETKLQGGRSLKQLRVVR